MEEPRERRVLDYEVHFKAGARDASFVSPDSITLLGGAVPFCLSIREDGDSLLGTIALCPAGSPDVACKPFLFHTTFSKIPQQNQFAQSVVWQYVNCAVSFFFHVNLFSVFQLKKVEERQCSHVSAALSLCKPSTTSASPFFFLSDKLITVSRLVALESSERL